jgi:hypothetical protein
VNDHPLAAVLRASPIGQQIDGCLHQLRTLTLSHAVLLVADDGMLLAQQGDVVYTDELRASVQRALGGRITHARAVGKVAEVAEPRAVAQQVADCVLLPPHWMLISLAQQSRPLPWVTTATQPLLDELRALLLTLP